MSLIELQSSLERVYITVTYVAIAHSSYSAVVTAVASQPIHQM